MPETRINPVIVIVFSLTIGIFFFIGGLCLIYLDLFTGIIDTKLDAQIGIGLLVFYCAISMFGLNILFQTFSRNLDELGEYYKSFTRSISNGTVNLIFVAMFVIAMIYLVIILIQPDLIFNHSDEKIRSNSQVLVSVCLGGFLGGFVRETYSRFINSRENLPNVFITNFWIIIFSLLGSILLSMIFFLLLRAGILKSESVDSFNLYGVTGISVITGYLSDRVITRFSVLYSTLFENNASPDNGTNQVQENREEN